MTTHQRRFLAQVALTLLGLVVIPLLVGAYRAKESTSDHAADIQALRSDMERVVDVVCESNPHARRCAKGTP